MLSRTCSAVVPAPAQLIRPIAPRADHQAQLDAQQDAQQDEELANEQYASYDDGGDTDADWGGADDSDF
jgi:hypothetical protein